MADLRFSPPQLVLVSGLGTTLITTWSPPVVTQQLPVPIELGSGTTGSAVSTTVPEIGLVWMMRLFRKA